MNVLAVQSNVSTRAAWFGVLVIQYEFEISIDREKSSKAYGRYDRLTRAGTCTSCMLKTSLSTSLQYLTSHGARILRDFEDAIERDGKGLPLHDASDGGIEQGVGEKREDDHEDKGRL